MKKLTVVVLIAAFVLGGCTGTASTPAKAAPEITGKISYETTYLKWVKETFGDAMWIYTNVEVENTGEAPLFLGDGMFSIKDQDGTVIASEKERAKAPQVIQPGEKGYYYSAILLTEGPYDASAVVLVVPDLDITPLKTTMAELHITEAYAVKGSFSNIDIIGEVKNLSESDATGVKCGAILFDDNKQPIGIIEDYIYELPAGEKVSFSAEGYFLPSAIRYPEKGKPPYGSFQSYAYEWTINK